MTQQQNSKFVPKHYLIKRSPDFTKNRVLVKRASKRKGYSETTISSQKRVPASCVLREGDTIYVAEKAGFIYAKGTVTELSEVIELKTVTEVFNFIKQTRRKDELYWFDKLKNLVAKQEKNPNAVIRFHEYFIDQKLLERTIPLDGQLQRLSKSGTQYPLIPLVDEEIKYFDNPKLKKTGRLDPKIPSGLRMDIFSLFNKEYSISHWIDIDHFVPKSSDGPGNIIENLVPVAMSLNRYKSDSIPREFFRQAQAHDSLRHWVRKEYLSSSVNFLKKKEFRKVIDDTKKINDYIAHNFEIEKAKAFYRAVLEHHHPEYVKIIDRFNS